MSTTQEVFTIGWQEFLAALPTAALLLELGGQVVAHNDAWQRLADGAVVSSAFLPGRGVVEGFTAVFPAGASAQAALAAGLQAVVAKRQAGCEFEYNYQCGDKPRWLTLTLSLLYLNGRERLLLQAWDITAYKQIEAELQEARERFDRIMAATTEGVFLSDAGRIVDVNEAVLRMLHYTREQMIGIDSFASLVAPDSLPEVTQRIGQGIGGSYDLILLRRDGTRVHVEATGTVVPYEGRLIRGSAVRDITVRKRSEQLLRESEERFRLLADLTSEALVLHRDGVILDSNAAASAMFGYSKEEMSGKAPAAIVTPDSQERVRAAMANDSEAPYEVTGVRKDGTTFPMLVTDRMLPYQGGVVRGTILHDLSLQRDAEVALRKSIAQEEKLRAQAQALAELSTPLIPINDRIMVMPLIGTIDGQRAQQVMESLLDGIARSGAAIAILDITGVPVVDAQVARALVQAARAVQLLGAQVVLTGIRAEVAQTLVQIGADLSGVVTRSTLQSGITYAMR